MSNEKQKLVFDGEDGTQVRGRRGGGYEVYYNADDGSRAVLCIPGAISAEALLAIGADLKPAPKVVKKAPAKKKAATSVIGD